MKIPPLTEYQQVNIFPKNGPNLRVIHMDCSIEYPLHSHDFYELVLIYYGFGTHINNGKQKNIQSGDILFIPEGGKHAYTKVNNLSYVNILFDKNVVPKNFFQLDSPFYCHISEYDMNKLLKTAKQMDIELYRRESDYALNSKAYLINLLIDIKRTLKRSNTIGNFVTKKRVQLVVDQITENLSISYTLNDLAEMAGTSPRNFSRIIKKLYNTSIFQYINKLRVEESLKLLIDSNMTITQISSLIGFDDSAYYSVVFKKIIGESPSAYRNEHSK